MFTSFILAATLSIAATPAQPSALLEREAPHAVALARADTFQVLLSLTPRLDHSRARAAIIRPIGEGAPDMILVTAATEPADLEGALEMLRQSRHTFGTNVNREMRAFVPPAADAELDTPAVRKAAANLSELRAAPEVQVPGFGLVRSMFIVVDELPHATPAAGAGNAGHGSH